MNRDTLRTVSILLSVLMLVIGILMLVLVQSFFNSMPKGEGGEQFANAMAAVVLAIMYIPFVIFYTATSVIPTVLSIVQKAKDTYKTSIANLIFHIVYIAFFGLLCYCVLLSAKMFSWYHLLFFAGLVTAIASLVVDIMILAAR